MSLASTGGRTGARARTWRAAFAGTVLGASALALLTFARAGSDSLPALLLAWAPYLFTGFGMNVLIGALSVGGGTLLGVLLGILQISPLRLLRWPALIYVQLFRNAPGLVLIFATSYALPYQFNVFGLSLPFPDWVKAVVGLGILASAYTAEITRGAILSIPTTQWEAARSLAFSRGQMLRWIILPQCARRALAPWMNLYSSITMSTALASLVGVNEMLHAATNASTSVQRVDFTIAVYLLTLLAFFFYCFPISRLTKRLEARFDIG